MPAQLDIIRYHLLPKAQTLYICVERDDYIGDFVARDDGHAGTKFTSMDIQVCAADAAGFDQGRTRRISYYIHWRELELGVGGGECVVVINVVVVD